MKICYVEQKLTNIGLIKNGKRNANIERGAELEKFTAVFL